MKRKYKRLRYQDVDWEEVKALTEWKRPEIVVKSRSLYLGKRSERKFYKLLTGIGIFLLFLWVLPKPYEYELNKYTWFGLNTLSDYQLIFYGFGLILIGMFGLYSRIYYKTRQKIVLLLLILLIFLGYYLH